MDDLVTLWRSFIVGFGIGCGWMLASRLGRLLDRCCRRRPVVMEFRGPPVGTSGVEGWTQTEGSEVQSRLEAGERGTQAAQHVGLGVPSGLIERDVGESTCYEDFCERAFPELQGLSRGSGDIVGSSEALEVLPGPVDRSGSPEVRFPSGQGQYDAASAYATATASDMEPLYVQRPVGFPPGDMIELARTPTVPLPPNYPYPENFGNRFVYADDEVELGEDSDSGDEASSIGQWTTDSGMPRGRGSSSAGSQGTGRSLTAVSLAASVQSAQAWQDAAQESDGTMELWLLLGMISVGCILVGAVGAIGCMWLCKCNTHRHQISAECTPTTPPTQGQKVAEKSSYSDRHVSEGPLQFSPVVNVTVRTQFQGEDCAQHERVEVLKRSSEDDIKEGLRQRGQQKTCESTVGPLKGLEPHRTRVEVSAMESAQSRVGPPKGLGPHRTCAEASAERPVQFPVGPPKGLDLSRTRAEASEVEPVQAPVGPPTGLGSHRTSVKAPEVEPGVSQVGPCGLGLPSIPTGSSDKVERPSGSSGDAQFDVQVSGSGRDLDQERPIVRADGFVEYPTRAGSRIMIDRIIRPRGFKKMDIYSCSADEPGVNVIFTKNGDCFHRSLECPAASKSSDIRRRQTCFVCNRGEGFPKQDTIYFNRWGKRVHVSRDCPALDPHQEVCARRRCKFCGSQ
ncbi:unnamed protein product [Symbiodinium sp. CCMP2592]|nr:unnamed protein product [Symbiodinium sp. CCMP2592]